MPSERIEKLDTILNNSGSKFVQLCPPLSSVPQVKIQETTIDLGPPAAFPWVYF